MTTKLRLPPEQDHEPPSIPVAGEPDFGSCREQHTATAFQPPSADEYGTAIGEFVQHLIVNTGASANESVEVRKAYGKSGKRQVELSIHTGQQLLNGADLQLSFFF